MTVLDLEPRTRKPVSSKPTMRRRLAIQPDELARAAEVDRERELRRLIALYGESVLAKCMRVTRDRHDAEDATQQAFIALAKRLAENELRGPIERPQAWLTRVAKRCAIDVVRARTSRRTHESAAATHRSNGNVAATGSQDASREVDARLAVQEVLSTLPANYKTPMVLFYFGGQTLESIAKQLGMTANAVGVKLHRGRSMLAKRLKARGIVMPAAAMTAVLVEVIRRQVSAGVTTSAGVAAGGSVTGTTMMAGTTLFAAKARWLAIAALVLGTASTIGARSSQLVQAGREAVQKIREAIDGVSLPKPSLSLPVMPTRIVTNDKPASQDDPANRDAAKRGSDVLPQYAALPNLNAIPSRAHAGAPPINTARPYTVVPGATIATTPPPLRNAGPSNALAMTAPGRPVGPTADARSGSQSASGFSGASGNRGPRDASVGGTDQGAAVADGTEFAGNVSTGAPKGPDALHGSDATGTSTAITSGISGDGYLSFLDQASGAGTTRTAGSSTGSTGRGLDVFGSTNDYSYNVGSSGLGGSSSDLGESDSIDPTDGIPRPTEYPALDGGEIPLDFDTYSPLWPGLQYASRRARAHALEGSSVGGSLTPGAVPEPTSLVVMVVTGAAMLSRRRR